MPRSSRRRRTNTGDLNGHGQQTETDDPPIDLAGNENGRLLAQNLEDGETVIDDTVFAEDYGWNNPHPYERNGQNIVQLLFRVSEDATRRNAYVHRGCECNSCGAVPIRGIRYHCANCADYDLCEGCESQGFHTKTHIFYKIRVPAPSFGPILSMPVAYSGDPESVEMRNLPKELTTKLSRETGFERPELDAYWEQWTFMANTEWRDDPDEIGLAMDRKTFEHCLVPSGGYRQAAPSLIFDRMFAFYDTNRDDLISFPEFLHGIAYRKKKDKWAKIFQGYDIDEDGYVDRKDFLRMFRSYYALYRQMHHDMLGGMQEQQMITSQAHQLVNGRQPLSSAFGADRYPRGADIRAGEGKRVQQNGELEVTDGRGVVNESGNDTGSRREVFLRNHAPWGFWDKDHGANAYLQTMLNPPQTVEQLANAAHNLNSARSTLRENRANDVRHAGGSQRSYSSASSYDEYLDPENDNTWLPDDITLTDEDVEAVLGPGKRLMDIQRSDRLAVISHAVHRDEAETTMYERWKKRQFYTDEEEGVTAPSNWKDEDDILAQHASAGESSKSRPSFHSRSSSKVRFAEDIDDYDTRSNPSTSSRSVPERWGGIELPDAEKDSGKEILFHVTQQAFNELLDPMFKDREDAAIKAAERKNDLEKYRALYSTPDFESWASEQKDIWTEEPKKVDKKIEIPEQTKPAWTDLPHLSDVEIPDLRQRPLEELLEASGYQLSPEAPIPGSGVEGAEHSNGDSKGDNEKDIEEEVLATSLPSSHPEIDSLTNGDVQNNYSPSDFSELSSISDTDEEVFRDPTMPQFMPDKVPAPSDLSKPNTSLRSTSERRTKLLPDEPSSSSHSESHKRDKLPSQVFLLRLWKINKDIKEAEKRGGWGKLNFEEFETRVKTFIKEGKGNQMDYLGSWIEFCIP